MDALSTEQIYVFRNTIFPTFETLSGSYEDRIAQIKQVNFQFSTDDLTCLMNPKFNEIYRKYHKNRDFIRYLRKYGKCIGNRFNDGQPIDPITMEIIPVNNVVIIKNFGYDKETTATFLRYGIKINPLTGLPLSADELYNMEVDSTVDADELLKFMHGY